MSNFFQIGTKNADSVDCHRIRHMHKSRIMLLLRVFFVRKIAQEQRSTNLLPQARRFCNVIFIMLIECDSIPRIQTSDIEHSDKTVRQGVLGCVLVDESSPRENIIMVNEAHTPADDGSSRAATAQPVASQLHFEPLSPDRFSKLLSSEQRRLLHEVVHEYTPKYSLPDRFITVFNVTSLDSGYAVAFNEHDEDDIAEPSRLRKKICRSLFLSNFSDEENSQQQHYSAFVHVAYPVAINRIRVFGSNLEEVAHGVISRISWRDYSSIADLFYKELSCSPLACRDLISSFNHCANSRRLVGKLSSDVWLYISNFVSPFVSLAVLRKTCRFFCRFTSSEKFWNSVQQFGLITWWFDETTDCRILLHRLKRVRSLTLYANFMETVRNFGPDIQLPMLRCLSFPRGTMDDQSCKLITLSCPNVEKLQFPSSEWLSDTGIESISRNCSNLKFLNLRCCVSISDRGLDALSKGCTSLEHLNLGYCSKITGAGVRVLTERLGGSLRALSLECCQNIGEAGLTAVYENCKLLRHLELEFCPVTDYIVVQLLHQCPELIHLNISFCPMVRGDCLRPLGLLKTLASNLRRLIVMGTSIGEHAIHAMQRKRPNISVEKTQGSLFHFLESSMLSQHQQILPSGAFQASMASGFHFP
eukprot:TRINITY_DN35951_c0_g2_i1.p1 TRINITY_DN35951_c0_g2~~TRINITY_DN35951_c0_g2_i1.p1  ORF type:complete len:644 (-),score=100.89 TRINITY_DN35951_c0_g2_i1:61-1992(-)